MKELPTDRHITYSIQYRRCGKVTCRTCQQGGKHGPYIYAYWRMASDAQPVTSMYIGKPPLSAEARELIARQREAHR